MTASSAARTRVGHIAIRARDAEATRRFYEQGLGLGFVGYRPSGTGSFDLSDGSVNLTVIPFDGDDRQVHVEGTEHIHIGVQVDDAAAVYRQLQSLGIPILRIDVKARLEASEAPPPGGSFKVADPDGNVVDVTGNPHEWRV